MGMIFDIQRCCVDDGPGIRTTVFLKGCPLNCLWCHNPESKDCRPQQSLDGKKIVGQESSVGEVISIVLMDKKYYAASSGGMTLSGGEPLMQPDFSYELLKTAKENQIHTCMETSGFAEEAVLRRLLPVVDLFLFDVKAPASTHRELTGVDHVQILLSLNFLYKHGAAIVLRCPIIPTKNDSEEHFSYLIYLKNKYPNILDIQILPYHNLGISKARSMGMNADFYMENPTKEQVEIWKARIKSDEK